MSYLKKDKLEVGKAYHCYARNFETGVWDGEAFEYMREKFGQKFKDREFHWDDGPPFGTVRPVAEVVNGTE